MTDRLRAKLKDLSELSDNWAGDGSLCVKPSELALKHTMEIVECFGPEIEAVTAIFPMHSGDICIQGKSQSGRYMIIVYHERYDVYDTFNDFTFLLKSNDGSKTHSSTGNISDETLKEIKEEITNILL